MSTVTTEPTTTTAPAVLMMRVDAIQRSELNPRKHFDQEHLDTLAESIQQHGVIQPITVRPLTVLGKSIGHGYVIVAGERRWRAAKLAGLEFVPVIVREGLTDEDHLRLAIVENLQRQDLDPIEEAEGYATLNRVVGLRQAEIASAVNRSQPAVANAMRLLELPEDVQALIRGRQLSVSHGIALARYKAFPALVSAMATMAVEKGWTAKYLEGDPYRSYEITKTRLSRQLHGFTFDTSVCLECPFNAYRGAPDRPDDTRFAYCLNPAHADQLEEEALADQRAKLAESAASGQAIIKLEDLAYDKYQRIRWANPLPAGCSADCACRLLALDERDKPVEICTNPKRFNQLRNAKEREQKAERRASVDGKVSEVLAEIDGLTTIGSYELALIVAPLVGARMPKATWATLRRHDEGLPAEPYLLGEHNAGESFYDILSRLDPLSLVKIGLEAQLRAELNNEDSGYGTSKRTAWWLDRPKPEIITIREVPAADDPPATVECGECGKTFSPADDGGIEAFSGLWFCTDCCPDVVGTEAAEDAVAEAIQDLPGDWGEAQAELKEWKAQTWSEGDEEGAE